MHPEMQIYMLQVKAQYPRYFNNVFVLDCGSLDVNGNNRYLFQYLREGGAQYYGIDRMEGDNVDEVCLIHEFIPRWRTSGVTQLAGGERENQNPTLTIDIILCVEVLEHDEHWTKSVAHMTDILRPGGMLIITAAGPKRKPHSAYIPGAKPEEDEHYMNMSEDLLRGAMDPDAHFARYEFAYGREMRDQYFWGIKR